MRITVTGSAGFLGRHVVPALLLRGHDVVAMVRPGSAIPDWLANCDLVTCDLHHPPDRCFDHLGEPDTLVHLAWGGLPNYKSDFHLTEELPAQKRFLQQLLSEGLGNLLVIGTCFEYGMQTGALSPETPTQPTTIYGRAKDDLHRHLQALQSECDFALTWARLFYVYGPGQAATSLRSLLEKAVANGDKSFPMSGGQQVRDFLAIEQVASQIANLATSPEPHRVTNICSGEPITVQALVERWIVENNWQIDLDLGRYPYPDYEPMSFWGVPSQAAKVPS